MKQAERRKKLIQYFIQENKEYEHLEIPEDEQAQKQLLRALMNVRMPAPVSSEFLALQDAYLQEEAAEKGIVDVQSLEEAGDGLYLWQGDITALKCDAIVNAANSRLLGCFHPNHNCIDNVIHSAAGVQLRNECARIMEEQNHLEPTGQAKITSGYNLPAKYVLHTVGPIVYGRLGTTEEEQLASCYRSCLEAANKNGLKSVAFCCISTGEFHFPNERAAEIAVQTVRQYKGDLKVVFNVFKDLDREIYSTLLRKQS